MQRRSSGFTLIELLVAMVIFAIMAALAYGGLRTLINTSAGVQEHMIRLETLQRAVMFIERDLRQLSARPVNTDVAKRKSAVEMEKSGTILIEFTRAGNPNPGGLIRSSLQRVRYSLEDGELSRLTWDYIDHLEIDEPVEMSLLRDLESVEIKLLDAKSKWQTSWGQTGSLDAIPIAVEIILEHKQWGKIRRLIPVFGS